MGDLFDSVLHIEDALVQQGVQNGRLNADKAVFEDGRQLGLVKGAEVGHELGFYFGQLVMCKAHASEKKDEENTKRAFDALNKLHDLIVAFPGDPSREDLFEQLDRIRGKYRQVASLLRLPVRSVPPHATSHLAF
jgi:hypothetical protein